MQFSPVRVVKKIGTFQRVKTDLYGTLFWRPVEVYPNVNRISLKPVFSVDSFCI